jgi:acyl dehydratase
MEYRVDARNTATESENRIHSDETARQYGFRGGLVPGVDVYAYMTHLPANAWGLDWLARGTMAARFLQPVHDSTTVEIAATSDDPDHEMQLELLNSAWDLCASADVSLPVAPPSELPAPDDVPGAPIPDHRPVASPESLAVGTVLGSLDVGFHADRSAAYLADVSEQSALYEEEGVAHPGWLLRFANAILVANVQLGPWIHVSSASTHFALVRDGQRVQTRARVIDEYERKGHRFVELDVLLVTDDDDPVMRIRHTAIYEPRRRVA